MEHGVFDKVIQRLWSDPNLYLMRDRIIQATFVSKLHWALKREVPPQGALEYQAWVLERARFWFSKLSDEQPSYLYFLSEPHNADNYIRLLVAEGLGIPIYISLGSRIKGYHYIGKGFARNPDLLRTCLAEDERRQYLAEVQDYASRALGDYSSVVPPAEMDLVKSNSGYEFAFFKHLRRHWKRPSYAWNALRCRKALRAHETGLDDLPEKFVVLFFHYQPERTTVPAGWGWAQQLGVAEVIARCLPDGVHLVLKEHPATFYRQCSPFVRWPHFYEQALSNDNVLWCDTTVDNFALLDRAKAVASVGGTVLQESLFRGVPCIRFGVRMGEEVFGEHRFTDMKSLNQFFTRIVNREFDSEQVIRSIKESTINDVEFVLPSKLAEDRGVIGNLLEADFEKNDSNAQSSTSPIKLSTATTGE